MKVALLCLSLLAVGLTACTTLENRRDMYCGYGHVHLLKAKAQEVKVTAAPDYKDVVK